VIILQNGFVKGLITGIGVTLLTVIMIMLVINFSIRRILMNEVKPNVNYGNATYQTQSNNVVPITRPQESKSAVDDFAERYKATERKIKEIENKMRER
jgi:hypothetical protein